MDERALWVWLQHAFGAGSSKPALILRRMTSLQAFYEAGSGFWRQCGFITDKEYLALTSYPPQRAQLQLEYCERAGFTVLTPADAAYPERLRQLNDLPCALYIRGTLPDVDHILSIAVVGSRHADASALAAARGISAELAARGVVVVSGGALGIDTAAHTGALYAEGTTVCVLPCGLDHPYLMENAMMREEVARCGALVTEYPENAGVFRGNFVVRNRLISGLSHGVLVVSAGEKSGTLLTAARAEEQNRDLFAVPGPVGDPLWKGALNLIRDGAKMVQTAQDILEEYTAWLPQTAAAKAEKSEVFYKKEEKTEKIPQKAGNFSKTGQNHLDELSGDAVTLWQVLHAQPCHINEIAAKAQLPVHRTLAALTELELAGLCESRAGGTYCRSRSYAAED